MILSLMVLMFWKCSKFESWPVLVETAVYQLKIAGIALTELSIQLFIHLYH